MDKKTWVEQKTKSIEASLNGIEDDYWSFLYNVSWGEVDEVSRLFEDIYDIHGEHENLNFYIFEDYIDLGFRDFDIIEGIKARIPYKVTNCYNRLSLRYFVDGGWAYFKHNGNCEFTKKPLEKIREFRSPEDRFINFLFKETFDFHPNILPQMEVFFRENWGNYDPNRLYLPKTGDNKLFFTNREKNCLDIQFNEKFLSMNKYFVNSDKNEGALVYYSEKDMIKTFFDWINDD